MYLLIVSGLSGAGKTHALKMFEDKGYFCVDNLPCEMLGGLVRLCAKAAPPVERAAVVIDSRESVFSYDITKALDALDGMALKYEVLFLDCRDEILERRYNETRRRHPVADEVREGIRRERELLNPIKHRANYVLDTSELRPPEFVRTLESLLRESYSSFMLTFESFGYKRGVPLEADVVIDVRFSRNPYYEPSLKYLCGRDPDIRDYVMQDENFKSLLDTVETMLDKLIPSFKEQGKHRLLVAFGCTGGRHRSVLAAEELHRRMKDKYDTRLIHRDMSEEAVDIKQRNGME